MVMENGRYGTARAPWPKMLVQLLIVLALCSCLNVGILRTRRLYEEEAEEEEVGKETRLNPLVNEVAEKVLNLQIDQEEENSYPQLVIVDGDELDDRDDEKLGECEGDCDDDDDCRGALKCYQRDSGDSDKVPGCSGEARSSRDYCIEVAPTPAPTPRPTEYRPPLVNVEKPDDDDDDDDYENNNYDPHLPQLVDIDSDDLDGRLLGLCEGDCDDDEDCSDGLICFSRSGTKKVPGCSGQGTKGDDYCIHPDALAWLNVCEGDCGSDEDCFGNLKCHKRSGTDFVPGCSGEGVSGDDYCIDPAAPGPDSHLETFRLRLQWTKSFDSHAGKWCADCSSGCSRGNDMQVKRCKSSSDEFRFLNLDGETTQIQVDGKDLCWEQVSNGDPNSIRLKTCDSTNPCQKFRSGLGSFHGYIFELISCYDKCVSQDHYPRGGEDLFGATCTTALRHYTNYWYKY